MKVAAYVRVSTEEQVAGYSLDAQRRAIAQHCTRCGHEIIAELADEGRSARTDSLEKRPGFRSAIEMVKARRAEAIVVHKPDRAARNLRLLLQILHELGGGIIAVEGDFDYTTPEGKLRAHIMGSVAQWYSDNLSRECKKGLDQRKRTGLWSGRLPIGYCKQEGRKDLPPVPDRHGVVEAEGRQWSQVDLVQLAFSLTADGESTRDVLERLRSLGSAWCRSTIDHVIHNRFYLGELPLDGRKTKGGRWVRGKHDAIVSPELFAAAQAARRRNTRGVRCAPRHAKTYSLSGLARCVRCHGPMHCRTDTLTKSEWLVCGNRMERGACDQPSVKIAPLEEQVAIALDVFSPAGALLERAVDQLRSARRDHKQERSTLQRRRRRLLDLYEWGEIDKADYSKRVGEIDRDLAALDGQEEPVNLEELRKFLRDLPALYRAADGSNRNRLARRLFESVMVDEWNVVAVKPRPVVDAALRHVSAEGPHVDVSDRLGTVGHVVPLPLADGWWTAPTAKNGPAGYRRNAAIHRVLWPTLAEERDAGESFRAIAERWGAHVDTVRRIYYKHRAWQRQLQGDA